MQKKYIKAVVIQYMNFWKACNNNNTYYRCISPWLRSWAENIEVLEAKWLTASPLTADPIVMLEPRRDATSRETKVHQENTVHSD